MLTVPSSSGCLISRTGEGGKATSLCEESMHISDTQQQARELQSGLAAAMLTVTLDVSWLSRAGAVAWVSGGVAS